MLHLHDLMHQLATSHGLAWIVLVAGMTYVLRRLRPSPLAFALVALPGTFCHELAHWLVGFISAARPTELVLLPERSGRGYALGAVKFTNIRWYNAALVGLAPLVLLPAAVHLLFWRMAVAYYPTTLASLSWAYLIACLLDGCAPSMQDLRVASRSWLLVIGLLVVLLSSYV